MQDWERHPRRARARRSARRSQRDRPAPAADRAGGRRRAPSARHRHRRRRAPRHAARRASTRPGRRGDERGTDHRAASARPRRRAARDRCAALGLHQVPARRCGARVVGLELLDELVARPAARDTRSCSWPAAWARRLRPLTDDTPKPLLQIGGRPLLETILESFVDQGFRRFFLAVNYKADMFEAALRRRRALGRRDRATSTRTSSSARPGALSLLPERPTQPLHRDERRPPDRASFAPACSTSTASTRRSRPIACANTSCQVPFGVVHMRDEPSLVGIEEKPCTALRQCRHLRPQPERPARLPRGALRHAQTCCSGDATAGERVVGFPIREYWLDIGRLDDLERAVEYFENGDAA